MFTLGVNISPPPKSPGNPRQYWVCAVFGRNRPLILRRGTVKTSISAPSPASPGGELPPSEVF